jgi:putative FmdB family regulatory protein
MPIYEYGCRNCGHTLDALQKISEDPLVDCPECGEASLKRLLSAPRFRLKGEGWYETDFKKDNQRNLAKDDGDKPATSDDKKAGSETKKDAAKPASKSSGESAKSTVAE